MIVIGFYLAGTGRTGVDGKAAVSFYAADAHSGQLGGYGGNAVTFLITDMADACDDSGVLGKRRDGSQGNGLVRAGGHIYGYPGERSLCGRTYQNSVRGILCGTAHFLQNPDKGHIPLKGVKMDMADQHRDA